MIDASRGIELLEDNPHVWVSISLMMREVENLAAGMAQVDPAHAETYKANATAYLLRLDALKQELHQQIDPLPNRAIVTFHEAFPYFAREFNLDIVAVVEREPDSQPSAAELAATVELIRSKNVHAIFVEPQYPAETAATLARETQVPVYTLDPAASGELNDPDAYIRIMRQNGRTLYEALR